MEIKTKLLDVSQLKAGMVTAKEIIYNGSILIGKDIELTNHLLDKLNLIYFLDKVEIYVSEEESKELIALEKVDETLKNITVDVKLLFDNTNTLKSATTNEVNKYAEKLLDELKNNSLFLKNIVLNGSGEDSIYRHSVNVAAVSYIIGKWAGFSENKLHSLVYASLLHDFGKTKISKQIINKTRRLTTEEFEIIKTHPRLTYNEIKEIPFIGQSVLYGVLMHHERNDGSGYPLGLKGPQIHDFGKIIAISDTFDALNSNRVHKKKRRPLEALKIIQEESLSKLDFKFCNIFLNGLKNFYVGQNAILNNNDTCKIIQLNTNNIDLPLVLTNNEFVDLSKSPYLHITEII